MSYLFGRLFLYWSIEGAIFAGWWLLHVCAGLRHQWGATPLLRVRWRR